MANQTLSKFECILINNNSTDGSSEIAQYWIQKDHRFKLISEKEQGVCFASNKGHKMAKGKYISRMDADDWAFPEKLRIQFNFLNENPEYGAVGTLVEHIGDKKNTKGFARYVEWSNSITTYNEILNARFIESPIVNPTAMWRREIADNFGTYLDGNFPEDYEMWLRWLHNGVKICKIPSVLLKWYDLPTRLTRTDPLYSDKSFFKIKSAYLAKWLERNNIHHSQILVWGASRISRRRAKLLEKYGVTITSYIDITRKRQIDKSVIFYQEIPPPTNAFVLVYIKQMDARKEIQQFLQSKGYVEGENYLLVS